MASFSFFQAALDSPQGKLLQVYTPSPHDGKFAVDLLHTLQAHTPLTAFQKAFLIVTITIPGSFDWKLSLFNSIYSISSTSILSPIIVTVIGGIFVIGVFYLFKWLGRKLFIKKEPLVFLELTFPTMNSKTPYATEQFFSLLHTLARQRSFAHRVFGHKKTYSLEITASKEQGIRYVLAIPGNESSIIGKSLLSFLPGLKIKEIDDYLPDDLRNKKKTDNGKKSGIIELKLSNDFVLPLQQHKALDEHDPIAYLTGNMTKLDPDELMVFQAVATPINRSTHRSVLRHLDKIQKLIYTNQPLTGALFTGMEQKVLAVPLVILMALLNAFSQFIQFFANIFLMIWDDANHINTRVQTRAVVQAVNSRQEILNPYEQQLQTEVKEKIDKQMFEVSLRLLVQSDNSSEYAVRTSGFLASLSSLGSPYQTLVEKKKLLHFWPSPFSAFAKRKASSNNPILSVSELTDIYHFPYTETTKTEDLVKSKNQPLPAPLSFKQTTTKFDNVFAKNNYGGSETLIGQTLEERRRHTYILGATGTGKTTLLAAMIYNDIVSGKGVGILDPHGQLVEKLLSVIPKERIKDVIWFAPDDDAYPIALNLLELPRGSFTSSQLQKQKSLVASSIISIFQKLYEAKYFGPRMEYVLRNAILTALETPSPTLQTILDLLTKKEYRKKVVEGLRNAVLKDYWVNEFEKLGSMQRNEVISPITNKIGGLLSSPINYNILTQEKSKLDFEDIINGGKILLCDLSKGKIGEDESSFFGSLVIAKIQLAALKRALISEEERRDFNLYIDEFQNFATATMAELVSEARKYRIATVLAHQSISQIPNRDIVKVVLANVGTVICFKTANPEDEQFILPIFSPEVLEYEIANLPLYNFYMKISVGNPQDAFLAQSDNFAAPDDEAITKKVIQESRKQYGTPVEELTQSETKIKKTVEEKENVKPAKKESVSKMTIKEIVTKEQKKPLAGRKISAKKGL